VLKPCFAWSMILVLLLSLVTTPGMAQEIQPQLQPLEVDYLARFRPVPAVPGELDVDLARLPPGVQAALGQGPPAYLVVELEGEPLAVRYARSLDGGVSTMSSASQVAHVRELEATQARLIPRLESMGGVIISSYQKAYNGIQIRISLDKMLTLAKLPGVKGVHRLPLYEVSNESSVPWIGATRVWDELGFDGTGVRVAVIDTGIDYYHADLGGSGDPADYAADDNTVIEPLTFPTAKVIGGYDFAGPFFDPSSDDPNEYIPQPDPDPLDGEGHGTSMAGTVAGLGVPGEIGPGVAPGALLYAVKIFRDHGPASTSLTLDGVEWAMDPNQDGDISDRVDVMNLSLGSSFGSPEEPSAVACNNAAMAGVIVVASAGNAGDVMYIHGAPGNAERVIGVAASVDNDPADNGRTVVRIDSPYSATYEAVEGANSRPLFETGDIVGEIVYVGEGCVETTGDEYLADPMDKVALIQRGTCSFQEKVAGVEAAGAVAAIVFDNRPGGLVNMALVSGIPAVFVSQADGQQIRAADAPVEGGLVRIPQPELVNTIPSFSSRGPRGPDSALKPDVTAPGFRINSASVSTGTGAEKGSGTSPAAAHVSGVAALLRQAHPDWTPEEVKAALMNTAADLSTTAGARYPLSRQGAGLVDAYRAATAEVMALTEGSSLSYGLVPVDSDTILTRQIQLVNKGSEDRTFTIDWSFQFSAQDAGQGVDLTLPPTVTVAAGSSVNVPVQLHIDVEALPEATYDFDAWEVQEYDGFIRFTPQGDLGAAMAESLRVPFLVIPRPTALTEGPAAIDWHAPYAAFALENAGPIDSSVYLLPGYGDDEQDADVGDHADIRFFGVDAFQPFANTVRMADTVISFAISTYAAWHTPQPHWNEFDIYIDIDEDGEDDYVVFNWNLGAVTGGANNDIFVPVIVNLTTGQISLPTWPAPYDGYLLTNYTEFNAATIEIPVKGTDIGLTDDNTDFAFTIAGWDYWGNVDVTATKWANAARSPFTFLWAEPRGIVPAQGANLAGVVVGDGYLHNSPTHILALYYNDAPGMSQAQWIPLAIGSWYRSFLPTIPKNSP
jgi:minor extracellular serine protease Vpr